MRKLFYYILRRVKKKTKESYTQIYEHIFAYIDSRILIKKKDKVLFIDLGSNLGQGYEWFSKFFKGPNIHFELFEPNPYCYEKLLQLKDYKEKKININNLGVGIKDDKVRFYGLHEDKYSMGGSTLKEHNSLFYSINDNDFIEVNVFDLGKYLIEKRKEFDKIIIKFDIEGLEIEILEKLLITNLIELIDIIYVEFHSQYLEPEISKGRRTRELQIIQALKSLKNIHFRLWH